jgi:predicted enzyme related to lactoylglutathione lyase
MKVNGIDSVFYSTHDLERAKTFYTFLIGSPPEIVMEGSFCEWTLSNGEAFGLIKGEQFRPGSGVLFSVDDVAAAVDELRSRGVAFEDDGEVEETPVCFMAFARDTEGNAFILHQPKRH